MLRYLGVGCIDGRILFRCRPSIIALRSIHIHHVPNSGCGRPPPSDLPPAAAKDPGWVMLNKQGIRTDDSFVADAKTVAYCRTSTGHHLRVSFRGAPPPASTFVYYDFTDITHGEEEEDSSDTAPDGNDDDNIAGECEEDDDVDESEEEEEYDVDDLRVSVFAAHGDSVLLRMSHQRFSDFEDDHFLYRAGGAASPPAMSLLPERDFLTKAEQVYVSPAIRPKLRSGLTCLLQRGDDDVLLVELDKLYDRSSRRYMVEFCLLRHGSSQWELKEPVPIIIHDGEGGDGDEHLRNRARCGSSTIIPLADRLLCWVRYECGFLLCDIGDEAASPKVRYVPLPPGVCWDPKGYEQDMTIKHSMNMGAAGARAVRFVSVDPHCCCGSPGKTTCAHSRYAFTINTWSMKNLSMDEPLTWVKDGEIDCEELWGLPGYKGLPRANLMCPIVSLDDPSVVCFLLSNDRLVSSYEDRKLWMIQLNINTKTLLSSVQYTYDAWVAYRHLPARIQY